MQMKKQSLLDKANQYIAEKKDTVDQRYRPRFHAVAPIGWINDPNGFFYDGEWYHLFYQHYPYAAEWNDMHWGHWRSKDLAVWENLPVAMAPDMSYDKSGCFSGTALPDGQGGAYILYTGVSRQGTLQQQCLARFDGQKITKSKLNPVIPFSLLPDGYIQKDFRDPKLIRTADGFRVVVSARDRQEGKLVSFSSPDLENWQFDGVFCKAEGIMPECPDVASLDGKTLVLYSKVDRKEKLLLHGRPVLYAIGSLNSEGTRFTADDVWNPLDHGREFYAEQTCTGEGGNLVAVGWMASWDADYPTALLSHGWSGMMSLPRILRLEEGRLIQEPVSGLKQLRGEHTRLSAELSGAHAGLQGIGARHAEIHFRADVRQAQAVILNVMEDGNERVSLIWRNNTLILSRSTVAYCQMGRLIPEVRMPLVPRNGQLDMTVFVDNCAVEIFTGGETMSALAFPTGEAYDISVSANGKASVDIDCWNLVKS